MATRLYFPVSTAAPVSPTPDAGWESTDGVVYRAFARVKGTSAITVGTTHDWTAAVNHQQCDRIYVSDPMAAQTLSPGNAWTWLGELMVREYAGTDNVDRLVSKLYVVSNDGTTVRGTLSALAHRGPTAEFVNNATHRSKQIAETSSPALSAVTCQDGDRLVLELGYECSTAPTTPQASAKWGENATDLPANDAGTTTDGAGWIELSGNIVWQDQLGWRGSYPQPRDLLPPARGIELTRLAAPIEPPSGPPPFDPAIFPHGSFDVAIQRASFSVPAGEVRPAIAPAAIPPPALSWHPTFPDRVPGSPPLNPAPWATTRPELDPPAIPPPALSWAPRYPDAVPGRAPLNLAPWACARPEIEPTQIPPPPLAWQSTFPALVPAASPLNLALWATTRPEVEQAPAPPPLLSWAPSYPAAVRAPLGPVERERLAEPIAPVAPPGFDPATFPWTRSLIELRTAPAASLSYFVEPILPPTPPPPFDPALFPWSQPLAPIRLSPTVPPVGYAGPGQPVATAPAVVVALVRIRRTLYGSYLIPSGLVSVRAPGKLVNSPPPGGLLM